jgi:Transposase and inactivated derivatives
MQRNNKEIKKELFVTEMLKKPDEKLKTKYKFEEKMRRWIHTNNPIERYFKELRRRIKAIGIFESISSADRLLFLMIESINQRRGSQPSFPDL